MKTFPYGPQDPDDIHEVEFENDMEAYKSQRQQDLDKAIFSIADPIPKTSWMPEFHPESAEAHLNSEQQHWWQHQDQEES